MTNIIEFLALVVAAVGFGAWCEHRVEVARREIHMLLVSQGRDTAVNDAADEAL